MSGSEPPPHMRPTTRLRWLVCGAERDYTWVLQQQWTDDSMTYYEWRDVEIVDETSTEE